MATFTRSEWGSVYPRGGNPIDHPVLEIYVHHYNSAIVAPNTLEGSLARVRDAQRYHVETKGWQDIAYSWLADDLGNLFEGRGWWRTGAHTEGSNSSGYGICWLGDSNVSPPTAAALRAITSCTRSGIALGAVTVAPNILGHRDRALSACPGDVLYALLPTLHAMLLNGQIPSGDDDMTDDERAMLIRIHGVLGNDQPGWGRPPSINDVVTIFADRLTAIDARIEAIAAKLGI